MEGPIFVEQNTKDMTNTTTVPVVKLNQDSVLAGDVFYGSFQTSVRGKGLTVSVSNHLKDTEKKYNFRVVSKCKAGFLNISDWNDAKPHEIIGGFKKNSLFNVQVEMVYESGKSLWFNVFTTKGGNWHSIDLGFLKVLTVGNMRTSFPSMCDMNLWSFVGAKTWADKAFVQN